MRYIGSMKTKIKYILFGILVLSFAIIAYYFTNGRQFGGFATWYLSSSNLRPSVSTWGVQIPSISGSTQCLQAGSTGVISGTGSACGSGGGGGAAWELYSPLTITPTTTNSGIWVTASSTIHNLTTTNHTTTNDLILSSTYIDDWYGSGRLRFNDEDGNNSDFVMTVAGGGFGTYVFAGADGTLTSPSGVDLDQVLGGLYFYGYANTGYKNAAFINGSVRSSGTISDTSMPGNIGIYTSPNNLVSPALQLDISSLSVTSSPKFVIGRTGYTTTSTISIGNTSAAGQGGGCIAIEDNDDSGYTYCTANNGVLTCGTTSCE